MRVLVTGGRDLWDDALVWGALSRFHRRLPISTLIHGACHLGGADELADGWAKANGVEREIYPVDHNVDGPWPQAGPNRNERMIRTSEPDIVIAFPGGKGTLDCKARAAARGILVLEKKAKEAA